MLTNLLYEEIICESTSEYVTDKYGYSYPLLDASAAVERAVNEEGDSTSFAGEALGMIEGRVYEKVKPDGGMVLTGEILKVPDSAKIVAYRIENVNGVNLETFSAFSELDSTGGFDLLVKKGRYRVIIYADGYVPILYSDVVVDSGEVVFLDSRLIPSLDEIAMNNVTGIICDALSGEARLYDVIAMLDLDDVTGYGPETVTVTIRVNKEMDYKYYVHDYSNRRNTSSTALSLSGAKVAVYCGNSLIKNFAVPINVEGICWGVFEIEDGELIEINNVQKSVDW